MVKRPQLETFSHGAAADVGLLCFHGAILRYTLATGSWSMCQRQLSRHVAVI